MKYSSQCLPCQGWFGKQYMPHRKRRHYIPPLTWLLVLIPVIIALATLKLSPDQYPSLKLDNGSATQISYAGLGQPTRARCDETLSKTETQLKAHCPTCQVVQRTCLTELPPSQAYYFTDQPQVFPSIHLNTGVLIFEATDASRVRQMCEETATGLRQSTDTKPTSCFPAEKKRPFFKADQKKIDTNHLWFALLGLILAQIVSKFICYLIIKYEHLHARYSHDHMQSGPQKFHAQPTPRIGGIPIILGLMASTTLLIQLPNRFPDMHLTLLLIAALPAFLGGLVEDITKRVGVSQRLVLTMLAGLLGCLLLDAIIPRLEIPGIDTLLTYTPVAIALTVFAVGGIANAINIIDGYNGLASGFGVAASAGIAIVAAMHGDAMLLYANLAMIGALLGFMAWNWPHGKIFLGDGGAYLLGFWLAECSILLVVRNPGVSVWFPMAVMVYPAFETLYSIYRRRILKKAHPGLPDSAHLHQLIFKRLVRVHVGTKDARKKTFRNAMVAPYFWALPSAFTLLATQFPDNTVALLLICIAYCLCYLWLYTKLRTWNPPGYLRVRIGHQTVLPSKNSTPTVDDRT